MTNELSEDLRPMPLAERSITSGYRWPKGPTADGLAHGQAQARHGLTRVGPVLARPDYRAVPGPPHRHDWAGTARRAATRRWVSLPLLPRHFPELEFGFFDKECIVFDPTISPHYKIKY
uniref:Uncharacterized protein n=1 Tax=Oryza glumipatula TaxID=40148 RepID=A0A0D9ZB69_9ORYZ